jgi:HEAT repeat protein
LFISGWLEKSTSARDRFALKTNLGHGGSGNDQVISSLIEILKSDAIAENRKEAALALGLVGKDSQKARQALTSALQDSDQTVKEAAQLALGAIK